MKIALITAIIVALASPVMAGEHLQHPGPATLPVAPAGGQTSNSTTSSYSSTGSYSTSESSPSQQTLSSSSVGDLTYNFGVSSPAIPKTTRVVTTPDVFAPALTTTLTETCMGSSSGGLSLMGFGSSFGTTWTDTECVIRLDARELASWGDKDAARAVMCEKARIRRAYAKIGKPCP